MTIELTAKLAGPLYGTMLYCVVGSYGYHKVYGATNRAVTVADRETAREIVKRTIELYVEQSEELHGPSVTLEKEELSAIGRLLEITA
jgi:transcriptional regulator of NAD metabolism